MSDDNTGTILTGLLDRKNGKPCEVCNAVHKKMNDPCTREALANKITRLYIANQAIPELMQNNKELLATCEHFQELLKKADEAHAILMQILSTYGDTGKEIETKYLEALNTWATGNLKSTSQDTLETTTKPSSPENSTSNVTEINDSTKLPSGKSLEADS